jgi:hypothetical protein
MISDTGLGLSVLIVTETEKDWQTFATWYSFYKNWPHAKVAIMVRRNGKTPFQFYQWAKRLKVRVNTTNEDFKADDWPERTRDGIEDINVLANLCMAETNRCIDKTVLVVRPLTMAVDVLDQKTLDRLNKSAMIKDGHVWFMKDQPWSQMIDEYMLKDRREPLDPEPLCVEAKDQEPSCLVSYAKGCGKWIDTAKGCPFSSAAAFVTPEMTANEHRIIELWKKMVPLYNAVV